jgi:hypothetical protein
VVVVAGGLYALWKASLPPLINVYCATVVVALALSNSLGFKLRLLVWLFPMAIAVAVLLKDWIRQYFLLILASTLPIALLLYTTLPGKVLYP